MSSKKSVAFIGFTAIFSIVLATMIIISVNAYKQETKNVEIGRQANQILKAKYFLNSIDYFEEKSLPKIFHKTQRDFIIKKEKEIISKLVAELETYETYDFKSCTSPQLNIIFWYNSVVEKQFENNICFPKVLENFEEEFLENFNNEIKKTHKRISVNLDREISTEIKNEKIIIKIKKTYEKNQFKIERESSHEFSLKEYKQTLQNLEENIKSFITCMEIIQQDFPQKERMCIENFKQENVHLKANRQGNTKDTTFLVYPIEVNFTTFSLTRTILIKQETPPLPIEQETGPNKEETALV